MQGARPDPGDLFDRKLIPHSNATLTNSRECCWLGRVTDRADLEYLACCCIMPLSSFMVRIIKICTASFSLTILDIFRTNANDKNISDTSSYLDLSPLYGYDNESQQTVRSKNPEKPGFLKPDTFADRRLLLQPPGVCIYLIMYNRFHNYVAEQLLAINENGKFSLPANWKDIQKNDPELFKRILKKQDEDIFQTARLSVLKPPWPHSTLLTLI